MKKLFVVGFSTVILLVLMGVGAFAQHDAKAELSPEDVLAKVWDHMRGDTSYSLTTMTVIRPKWQRTSKIKVWTKGREDSIFQIVAPAKDKGNGTLKKGRQMWTYNPKINRVVKIPPSMMSQSWMGSDFSNNDLSKADSILVDYTHQVEKMELLNGMRVYTIRSTPHDDAPVVWGMQRLIVREDGILLKEIYYDEDLEPVKILSTDKIVDMGGRLFPQVWTMRSVDENGEGLTDEYTELTYEVLEFDIALKKGLFNINALKKPVR
ncbi:MAG: outer membrane lipoprotein-sorting protein [Desulfovibrio sp.]